MPSVIDSLIVTLGLDSSGFKSGVQELDRGMKVTRDSVKQGAQEIGGRLKVVAETVQGLKRDLLGVAAIFLGGLGLKDFAQHIDSVDAATGRVASSIGMSVELLSAWEGAIKRAGGSAQEADGFFKNLQSHIQQYAITGQPDQFLALFPKIRFFDDKGQERPLGDIFRDIIAQIQGLPKAQQTQILSMIGGGQGIANLTEMGLPQVNKLLSEQQQRGVLTDAQVQAAIKFQNAWQNIKDDIETVGRLIWSNLEPSLTKVFNDWDDWYRAHQQLISADIPKYIGEVTTALGGAEKAGYALLGVFAVTTLAPVFGAISKFTSLVKALTGAEAAAAAGGAGLLSKLGPLGVFLYETLHPTSTESQQEDTPNGPQGTPVPNDTPTGAYPDGYTPNGPQGTPVSPDTPTGAYPDGYTPGAAPVSNDPRTAQGLWIRRMPELVGGLPAAPQAPAAPSGGGPVTIDTRTTEAHDYLQSQLGLTDAQTAGLLASLKSESNFDPAARNPKSGALGLAQWLGPRLKLFRQIYGHDPGQAPGDYERELQFIVYEFHHSQASALAKLKAQGNSGDSTNAATQFYEAPSAAEQQGSEERRLSWAQQFQGAFVAPPVAVPPPVPPSLMSPVAAAGPGVGDTNNNTQIGPITINAPSGDANQIAMALKKRLDGYRIVAAANTGLA